MQPSNPIFANIFVPNTLEDNAEDLLKTWFPTYLREVERLLDLTLDSLPAPPRYTKRNSLDVTRGEDLPSVVVISPGVHGTPVKDGQGQYRASWRLGVGIAIAADTDEEANSIVKIYGAAIRAMMLQKGGKYGLGNIQWIDESYDDLPMPEQLKQYRGASIWFVCDVNNVVTKKQGPDEPDAEPYFYPLADTVDVTLVRK